MKQPRKHSFDFGLHRLRRIRNSDALIQALANLAWLG